MKREKPVLLQRKWLSQFQVCSCLYVRGLLYLLNKNLPRLIGLLFWIKPLFETVFQYIYQTAFQRVVVVVVALLFYVHGKHLRSCRDGQLT